MANLSDLPDEVLLEIIANVPLCRDLAALSLQCRRLNAICDMTTRKWYDRIRLQQENDGDHALALLRGIIRHPWRGQYVRHIRFDHTGYRVVDFWYGKPPDGEVQEDDQLRLMEVAREAGFIEAHASWIVELVLNADGPVQSQPRSGQGPIDKLSEKERLFLRGQALAVLLISMSPALQSLTLFDFCPYSWDEEKFKSVPLRMWLESLQTDTKLGRHLSNLQTLNLITDSQIDSSNVLRDLHLLVKLPAINELFIGVDKGFVTYPGIKPHSINISKIHVRNANVDPGFLIHLFLASTKLLEFSLSSKICQFKPRWDPQLVQALMSHRQTLQILDIDARYHDSFPYGDVPTTVDGGPDETAKGNTDSTLHPPGLLKQFTALKRMTVDVFFLFYYGIGVEPSQSSVEGYPRLVDNLPPNLEYFCVRGHYHGDDSSHFGKYDRSLEEVLEEGETYLPHLKEVKGIKEHFDDREEVADSVYLAKLAEWKDLDY